ncbi:Uncharacterised protein family (UPF0125) [Raoultella planticola]|uniref:RnfH family protein n=1 Tax=Raoultella planticola TaxID=575 RepID=A0A485C0T1_RAOPL|nr:Uncharacterised protein family (UPF0125) [Raoultella planticola]
MSANIVVEVAYALPEKQYLQSVKLEEGATVEQAIIASGLLAAARRYRSGEEQGRNIQSPG